MPGLIGIYMGQNNDVAWTFTNAMADVEDLFVERIEGEDYLFEGRMAPAPGHARGDPVKGRAEPGQLQVRLTHHGPIVNDFLVADEAEPLALRWAALDAAAINSSHVGSIDATSGRELVELLEAHTVPVSNLVWADRESIGYKLVGTLPLRRGGCPDLPKPGWTSRLSGRDRALRRAGRAHRSGLGMIVTANNRIVGDDYPHHVSSEYLDGFRARRIEELLASAEEHDLDGFARIQIGRSLDPGSRGEAPSRPAAGTGAARAAGGRAAAKLER